MADLTRRQKINLGLLVAAIGACGALLTSVSQSWVSSLLEAPRLKREVQELKDAISKQDSLRKEQLASKDFLLATRTAEVKAKTAEVQLLETKFTPFKTIAIEKFTGTESERLAKLALLLNDLQTSVQVLSKNQNETISKTAEIQERLSQRSLSKEQRAKLISVLSSIPDKGAISVTYGSDSREIVTFAQEIFEILKLSGFRLEDGFGLMYAVGTVLPTKAPWHVAVIIDPGPQPTYAGPLQKALQSVGIDAEGIVDDRKLLPWPALVKIYIGSK